MRLYYNAHSSCLLLLLLSSFLTVDCQQTSTERPPSRRVTIPPLIVEEPTQEAAFREGESLQLPCVATGEPQPTYRWQMNQQDFDPSGTDGRIATQPGVGTLIFANPLKRDEAQYQCFAENQVGTAITVKINLRQAYLEPFITTSTINHRPRLGASLTLRCIPPKSFPKADVFWATIVAGQTFTPIDLTDRLTMDPEGNLHIVHVMTEDRRNLQKYACIAHNTVMRLTQQGAYATVDPQGETPENHAPQILWISPTTQVTLRGTIWRIKCIFSGNPTPRVDWYRSGADMPTGRYRTESFGQELVIEDVQMEDEGKYECQGINDEAQTPTIRSFTLKIEAKPYWTRRPESIDAAEKDQAIFYCEAKGLPEPNFFWFLNGVPIEKVPADPRRIAEKNRLIFNNMTKDDAQVIQCNATNKHGYIFANAYLNVLTEPPIVRDPPLIGQKAAEGQTINLNCLVFGSPKPLVVWRKGTEQLTGGRFKVLPEGHLQIQDVSLVDSGSYRCTATNIHGEDSATGSLIVRRKTLIQTRPLDVMVYEGTEAKFTCTATTDPEEVQNLRIDWKKDGQIIDYALAQRIFKNDMDNSLTISGTISLDTGKYTCMASDGLDSDEAEAQLIVQAPPDPPNNVIVRCTNNERKAEIEWQPGKENYAPILNYVIQFNTSFTPDTWIDIATNVTQNTRKTTVVLSPFGNYTFRVLARNKIGMSYPSEHTKTVCTTEPAQPTKNPENVIGEGDMPNNLVIFWTPMPKIEQNGNGFVYVLTWKRADTPGDPEQSYPVDIPDAWHHVIELNNVPAYTPYYISVKAKNSMGDSTLTPIKVLGFSGETEPELYPEDLEVLEHTIMDTTAVLMWTQVDTSPDYIHGFFRGYRIQYGKDSEWPDNIREQDFIINEPPFYPRPRVKRQLGPIKVNYTVKHLPPFTDVRLQIRVLNKYYAGPPSPPIHFRTLVGEPGPPSTFDVTARGSTFFELEWAAPYEPNGELVGYNMSYQTITGLNLGRIQYRDHITDPEATNARLTGLSPDTYYRVYLSAATSRGSGEPIFLDMKTLPANDPSPPTFAITDMNDTMVLIEWEPSRSQNPGSVFYVQYRYRGAYAWLHSPDEYMEYKMYIHDLDPGTTYQVRVVAKNGENAESPSEWQEFHTNGVAPGNYDLKASFWFYGIFLSFLLIILLLVGFIIFKKTTDKWWEQKESDIADQIKHLQAEEAVRQMGLFNAYAETGSREQVAENIHMPLAGAEPIEDEYSDDDDEEDDGGFGGSSAPPYDSVVQPAYPMQPAGYNVQGQPFVNINQPHDLNRSRDSAADTFV